MATNLVDILNLSNKEQESPKTFEQAFGAVPTSDQLSGGEADSFGNRLGRSFNESQKSFFDGVDVFAKKFGFSDLSDYAKLKSAEQELDIASYGIPSRTASLTKGMDEISQTYADKGIGEAVYRGLLLAKDMSADALGSMALPVAAGLSAIPVAAVSPAAGAVTALAAPFLISTPMGAGQIYEGAKELNAPEEDAQAYAIGGGAVVGLLDKIGVSSIIRGLVKSYTRDAIVKEFSKELGESTARRVVDGALDFGKTLTVGGTKAGLTEAVTETGQEAVQMLASGMAAGYEGFPYESAVVQQRLIDAAALGFVGGKTVGTMADFAQNNIDRVVAKRAEEIEQYAENMEKANLDTENNISTAFVSEQGRQADEKAKEGFSVFDSIFKQAITPLFSLGRKTEAGGQIVNEMQNFPNKFSAAVGMDAEPVRDVFQNLKRSLKLPFQRAIDKKAMDKLYYQMTRGLDSGDPKIREAAERLRENVFGTVEIDPATGQARKPVKITSDSLVAAIQTNAPLSEIQQLLQENSITPEQVSAFEQAIKPLQESYAARVAAAPTEASAILSDIKKSNEFQQLVGQELYKPKATGLYAKMLNAGIDIDFTQGYLPVVYKTGFLDRRKMFKVFTDSVNPTTNRKYTKNEAARIIDNIAGNEGIYNPKQTSIDLGYKQETARVSPTEQSFEQARTIPEPVRKKLEEEGLVETDVEALTYRYIFDANRRILAEQLRKVIEGNGKKLIADGDINDNEIKHIKDLYNALQSKYKPISSPTYQTAQRWVMTANYILTLPLAGLSAITEPILILSRLSPKASLFGLMNASVNGLKAGLRTIFPKLKMNKREEVFKGILEGLDGALAERFGDIANVTVSRKITNSFFRLTLLTQITQFSRDIAFQASRKQMTDDLKTVNLIDTPNPDGSKKKKTKEYVNAKRRLLEQGLTRPNDPKLQDWAAGKFNRDPEIIRQALAKTVREFIMAPDAINRPLWMSNPYLAPVAQLKGFMMVFGNTVGGRMYREIFQPLFKGRLPADEIFKYAMTFALLTGATLYVKALKDAIRYGDEESPFDKMEGLDKFIEALLSTNIFGSGTIVWDALNAQRFGSDFWSSILGPTASRISGISKGVSQYLSDEPRALAGEIAKLIPFLSIIPTVRPFKDEIVSHIEDYLQAARDKITDIFD